MRCALLVVRRSLSVVNGSLFMFVVCGKLFVVFLFNVCCVLLVVCCLLFVASSLLLVVCVFAFCCSVSFVV